MNNHKTLEKHLDMRNTDVWRSLHIERNRNTFLIKPTRNTPEYQVDSMLRDVFEAANELQGWNTRYIYEGGTIKGVHIRAPLLMHMNGQL